MVYSAEVVDWLKKNEDNDRFCIICRNYFMFYILFSKKGIDFMNDNVLNPF